MKLKTVVVVLGILFAQLGAVAQDQPVTLKMVNGTEVKFLTDLVKFEGQVVFPDEGKDFIKGEVNGEKTKISRSEIASVVLGDQEYLVFRNAGKTATEYIIGFFITNNDFKIFKSYLHGHRGYGSSTSINKVTTEEYFVLEDNKLRALDVKKDSEKLASSCTAFKQYLDQKGRVKGKETEEVFKYYDSNCSK